MQKIIKLALVISLVAAAAPVAQAQDSSSGCGLGWMVTQRQSLVSSWIRNSTNMTFSNTIAMTFGTSGCARHEIVLNNKKATHFAEANFDHLMIEMAQGQGEFLSAFAETLGCDANATKSFAQITRAHYGEIFATDSTPAGVLMRTQAIVDSNPELALHCQSAQIVALN